MINILDLLFYKLYISYDKKKDVPVESAIIFLALIRFSLYLLIALTLRILTNGILVPQSKAMALGLLVLLETPWLIWSNNRYNNKQILEIIKDKYSDSRYNSVKSWHVFILPILILVMTGIIVVLFSGGEFMPESN